MTAYHQTLDHCFSNSSGIDKAIYEKNLTSLSKEIASLMTKPCRLTEALLNLPFVTDDLAEITGLAERIRKEFKHIVVIGSGGSGLSGRMLAHIANPVSPAHVHFLENIDPELMESLLGTIDCASTCFIIISKSGTTVETISQFYALLNFMQERAGVPDVGRHFVVITMPDDSILRKTATEYGMAILNHPADIGGRFSALTAVGLLPAALCGLDIAALRQGAAEAVKQLQNTPQVMEIPSACGAALQHAAMQSGKNISVMLPYSERLCGFSAWYRQSWAESLGKDGKGTTPIRAVGSTDQHSQLQLYLSGPKDKLFTLIICRRASTGLSINAPKHLEYLAGKTLGDVMEAEQRATLATLVRNQCPVRVIELDKLSEHTMGSLLMHFTLEIILMAKLLNVNPFDQPAVEEGKQLARDYLLRKSA